MLRYVDLCVEMKAGRKCKDGLINYRNTVQQVRAGLGPVSARRRQCSRGAGEGG